MKKAKKNRLFLRWPSILLALLLFFLPGCSADHAAASPTPSADSSGADSADSNTVTLPTTGTGSALLDTMHISAATAVLADADTGEILYDQDAHVRRYPASITKVMTSLLVIEAVDRGELSLDQQVTVGQSVYSGIGAGGSTQDIKPGEILTVRDLLYCALVPSANEACNAMAEALSGSIPNFIDLMNARAAELGMEGTHFANTHGYHDPDHYTCAYDVFLMCREAMKHPTFREIVSSKEYTVPATNLSEPRRVHSTNALISTWYVTRYYYPKATGIKTGSTPEAGYCLASAATSGDKSLISVIMGGENYRDNAESNYFTESARLLKWGFDTFIVQTILDKSEIDIAEIPVTLSKEQNYITVHPAQTIQTTLPRDMDISAFERRIDLPDSVEAPIEKDQVLGTVTIYYRDKLYGTVDLLANDTVTRSQSLYYLARVQQVVNSLWFKLAVAAIIVGILLLLLRRALLGQGRSRYTPKRRAKSKAASGVHYTGIRRRR